MDINLAVLYKPCSHIYQLHRTPLILTEAYRICLQTLDVPCHRYRRSLDKL